MAIIKDINQLKPMLDTVKTMQTINKSADVLASPTTSDDGFARVERIITGINDMFKNVLQLQSLRNGLQGQSGFPMHEVPESAKGHTSADEHFARGKTAQPDKGNEKVKLVLKQVLAAAEQHINACAAENPNMLLGEMIARIDINATQLKALMSVLKTQM